MTFQTGWTLSWRVRRRLSAALLLLLLAAPAPAATPLELVREGRFAEARAALAPAIAGRADAALHAAFLEGLIAARQGNNDGAIRIFREILRVAPDYAPARRELAALLLITRQGEAALYHAERLDSSNARLREQIRAAVAAGAGPSRGAALRFSLVPSTNANRGTQAEEITIGGLPFRIDDGARAGRGTTATLGGTAWRRWRLSPAMTGTLTGSLDQSAFDDDRADQTVAAASFLLSRAMGRARLTFGPTYEARWLDGDLALKRPGLALAASAPLGERGRLLFSLEAQAQRFPGASFRDGERFEAALGYRRLAAPGLVLGIALEAERETAGVPHLGRSELGLRLEAEREWRGGLITDLELARHWDNYDGDFPGFAVPRADRVTALSLRLRHRGLAWRGLAPEVSLTALRSGSNVQFYDYDAVDVGMHLSREF